MNTVIQATLNNLNDEMSREEVVKASIKTTIGMLKDAIHMSFDEWETIHNIDAVIRRIENEIK